MHRDNILKLVGLTFVALLVIGTLVVKVDQQKTAQVTSKSEQRTHQKTKELRLTLKEFSHNEKLRYCSVIYYAVKHGKIQRWQEVANFKRGWQVEIYPGKPNRYLVWPDKRITKDEKMLEPNWFTFSSNGQVIYDSFGVHTFRKDLTETVQISKIIATINRDHAVKKVHQMQQNLVIKKQSGVKR